MCCKIVAIQCVDYGPQMERLSSSDVLVKDLYKENAHLTSLVQKLEEQNLFVDRSIMSCSTV